MFDILFKKKNTKRTKEWKSSFDKSKVNKISLLKWEEHCVECAVPYCYNNCLLYEAREDKRCIRLIGGLQRDYTYAGLYPYGIHCVFKKWSKLETIISPTMLSYKKMRLIEMLDNFFCLFFLAISRLFSYLSHRYILLRGYVFYKTKFFAWLNLNIKPNIPDFLWIECDNLELKDVQLLVQTYTPEKILYSEIYILNPGKNNVEIPCSKLYIKGEKQIRLLVSPLSEENTEISFSWLELVKLAKNPPKDILSPAEKVKCVAWDLDNTIWEGTLIEDGEEHIQLNHKAVEVIKRLDERGILNTIVSKNNYEDAMKVLTNLGLNEYFIYPAINWGQKSENIKAIAKRINIGIDTFAFIDDNIRERAEVQESLPIVRVYSDVEIDAILEKKEFDVPITEMSRKRRLSYLTDIKREELKGNFAENYDEYIRSLQMELTISTIDNNLIKNRCYELLLRSNQLNLSTNRYSIEEYETLLNDEKTICLAFYCKDKFGDYGNIGFISIKINDKEAIITDLVISCRIAKKKVENAMIYAIQNILVNKGIWILKANLFKTKKNFPLVDMFSSLPFRKLNENEKNIIFQIDDLNTLQDQQLIHIIYQNNCNK